MRRLLTIFFCLCLAACSDKESDKAHIVLLARGTAKVYTTEYSLHKDIIFDGDDVYAILGHEFQLPGDRRIDIPFRVTAKAYVDFSSFSEQNVDISDGNVVITLPDPVIEIISATPDYSNIKEDTSWWRQSFTSEEKERCIRQGLAQIKDDIALALSPDDLLREARINAFNSLAPVIISLGYERENVSIRFPNDYSGPELESIIDKRKLD